MKEVQLLDHYIFAWLYELHRCKFKEWESFVNKVLIEYFSLFIRNRK